MSQRLPRLAGLLAAAVLACAGPGGAPAPPLEIPALAGPASRPEHVVLVSLSGLASDRYRSDAGMAATMPALAALAGAGVAADAVEGVPPASLYPAHATLVTGEPPAGHGIVADRLLGPQGVRAVRYSHATSLRAPTLWQRTTEAGRSVAALAWPTTVGAEIAMRLPDLEPVRGGDTWLGVLADAASPELLALARASGGEAPAANAPGPVRDGVLVGVACSLLESSQPPALLLLRLSQTEQPLLLHGPGSPEADAAFASADGEIARLFACLRRGPARDSAAFLVAGDRGFAPVYGVLAPNSALARAGLLTPVPGVETSVTKWSAIARSNGGSAFVYAQNERDAVLARRALEKEAARVGSFRVVAAEELLRGGADPEAWFGLEGDPGFVFDDAAAGAFLVPAAIRGASGYLPSRAAMDTGFVAWGRGLRTRVRIPRMKQTDVAPTAAALLGIELGEATGRPLIGALDLPPG
ncbi:MAG TPA: alkaline phosphatase family protein [Myxococcota bacterium]|jgi:predicted AlkP superfamily pyrophosphatase or phosphodiesterase